MLTIKLKKVLIVLIIIVLLSVAIFFGIAHGGDRIKIGYSNEMHRFMTYQMSLKHEHQFHPSPAHNHVDVDITPYHPYFHQHGNYDIHQHGGQYGHSKYKNYHYAKHFHWEEWMKMRKCFPNGVYHRDDSDKMTMYSYCIPAPPPFVNKKGICYSFSIDDPKEKEIK